MFSIEGRRKGMLSDVKPEELENSLLKNLKDITLVIFSAPHSGESKMLYASIAELAEEYPSGVRFFNIDASNQADYIKSQCIRSLPALFIYKKSEIVYEGSGLHSKSMLRKALKQHMS